MTSPLRAHSFRGARKKKSHEKIIRGGKAEWSWRTETDWSFPCYAGTERSCCQPLCRERKIDHRTSFFSTRGSSGPPQKYPLLNSRGPDLYLKKEKKKENKKNLHVRPVRVRASWSSAAAALLFLLLAGACSPPSVFLERPRCELSHHF